MKTKYLLFVGMVVVLASCSSAYRNGQTPDDVYYSPAPAAESYVVKNNSNDRNNYRNNNDDRYSYTEERNIRQGIQNPRYRNTVSLSMGMGYGSFNSFGYDPFYYNPYGFNPYGFSSYGYNPYYGNGFNNSFGYNPYYNYNPYYPSFGFNPHYGNSYYPPASYYPVPGKSSSNRGARMVNLGSYTPARPSTAPRGVTTPMKSDVFRSAPIAPVRTFESRTNSSTPVRKEKSGLGSEIRRVFTPSNRDNYTPPANNNRRTERSNTPPVRRFDPPVRSTEPPVRSNNTPPVRNSTPPVRSTNNPPVRTFDPAPTVSAPAPSASSSTPPAREASSTPVRTFRNNN